MAGVIIEQSIGSFYKRNLSANDQIISDGPTNPMSTTAPKPGALELICPKPSSLISDGSFFSDVTGSGL
jgi:hypothetical protein